MTGRELPPSSPFAGDDGSADPGLAALLAAHGDGVGALADVVAALAPTRVLVPVLPAGIAAVQARDGRVAMPIFSCVDAMAEWRPDARAVPTDVRRAAVSALGEGWEVLVLDPAGPVPVLVPRPAVVALAAGEHWAPAIAGGEVDAAVRAAVARALARIPHVTRADAAPGRRAEVGVLLELEHGLDRTRLDAVLAQVNEAIAADETIAARVDSIELRLTSSP